MDNGGHEEQIERGSALYQQGRQAMSANDLQAATRLLEKSAQLSPHFKTFELLGECLLKSGQSQEASVWLRKAVEIGNKPYRALYLLGRALNDSGEREVAIACLVRALELKPDYKAARLLLDTLQSPKT
jgi:tetratricopeptide (TPR) repeat protein